MLANMASSLILNKRITTTTAKAKELRTYIEPLITKAKTDNTHSRRTVFSYLKDKEAVSELFRDVAEKVGERPGGYTRILKTGNRLGDNAEMCFIELVDYNDTYTRTEDKKGGSSKRRRRRGGKKKSQKTEGGQTAQPTAGDQEAGEQQETQQATREEAQGPDSSQEDAGAESGAGQEHSGEQTENKDGGKDKSSDDQKKEE